MNTTTTPVIIPEKRLLEFHAATDTPALWAAMNGLFEEMFRPHFTVAALRFMAAQPTVTLRTRPAPKRSAAWWRRNIAVHPGIEWLMRNPGAQLARVSDIMPVDELRRHPYYTAFIEPEGWLHGMGFFFWEGYNLTAILGVNRTEAQGDFTAAEAEACRALYPHLQVALRRVAEIEGKLNAQEAFARLILQLPQPTLMLNWDGRLLYVNNAAEASLARWTGRRATAAIPAEILDAAKALRTRLEARAAANQPLPEVEPRTVVTGKQRSLGATIEVVHLNAAPLSPPTFLVQFTKDPAGVTALARLTVRERELALLLCDGRSNKELAAALGKSEHTVKNQLKTVFRKLEIRSRAQLAGLLSRAH